MPKCPACPLAALGLDRPCLAELDPRFVGAYCERWATGTDHERASIVARSEYPPPAPRVPVEMGGVVPVPEATPDRTAAVLSGIPLAGDLVEAIAHRIGADRLAAWWERRSGKSCGCKDRQAALNAASLKLLRWAGLEPPRRES